MTLSEPASWAMLLATGGTIAATWRQIVALLRRTADLVICRVAVKNQLSEAVMSFVWENGRRSPFGLRSFGGERTYVHPAKRVEVVAYESVSSEPLLFWFRGRPIIVGLFYGGANNDRANLGRVNDSGGVGTAVGLTFLRGTIDVDQFVIEATQHFNALHHVQAEKTNGTHHRRRFNVRRFGRRVQESSKRDGDANAVPALTAGNSLNEFQDMLLTKSVRLLGWRPDDLVQSNDGQSPFAAYPFPQPVFSALDEIRVWLENEKWFRAKGVPWRRGWLLYGPPGSGKSTLVRSLAMEFDLPIYVFDLAGMDNQSFPEYWQEVQQNAPAIALIEDIDGVFEGRKNIAHTGKLAAAALTFDCLLNTISGVSNSDGVLLMVTTNRVDALDPALGIPINGRSSRPGRIDRVINLGPMEEPERLLLARHVLSDYSDRIATTVAEGNGETAAQFQDRCAQLALKLFWGARSGRLT